jgi:hypothetical protein
MDALSGQRFIQCFGMRLGPVLGERSILGAKKLANIPGGKMALTRRMLPKMRFQRFEVVCAAELASTDVRKLVEISLEIQSHARASSGL